MTEGNPFWDRIRKHLESDNHGYVIAGSIGEIAILLDWALYNLPANDEDVLEPPHYLKFKITESGSKIEGQSLAILTCFLKNLKITDIKPNDHVELDRFLTRIDENIEEFSDEFDTQIEFKIKYRSGEMIRVWAYGTHRNWCLKTTFYL